MAKIISTNPAKNYEVVGEVEISSDEEIAEKVKNAKEAKLIWKGLGVKKRIDLIKPIYEEFLNRKEELIELIIKEIGKTKMIIPKPELTAGTEELFNTEIKSKLSEYVF